MLSVKVLFPGGSILFKHKGGQWFHYHHVTRTVTDVNTYDAPVWDLYDSNYPHNNTRKGYLDI